MSGEQFANYVEQRLSIYDDIEVLDREGFELRLRASGADVAADLGTFYAAYMRDPGQLDVVFETFVRSVLGIQPDRSTSTYSDLSERIYPM
ncbi:hypothetical protein SE17_32615, partial [Kouleothrix aurantiaca]